MMKVQSQSSQGPYSRRNHFSNVRFTGKLNPVITPRILTHTPHWEDQNPRIMKHSLFSQLSRPRAKAQDYLNKKSLELCSLLVIGTSTPQSQSYFFQQNKISFWLVTDDKIPLSILNSSIKLRTLLEKYFEQDLHSNPELLKCVKKISKPLSLSFRSTCQLKNMPPLIDVMHHLNIFKLCAQDLWSQSRSSGTYHLMPAQV